MLARSSVFYMGRRFTARHLARVRSPLLNGFVSPLSGSLSMHTAASPPLMWAGVTTSDIALAISSLSPEVASQMDGSVAKVLQVWCQLFIQARIAVFSMPFILHEIESRTKGPLSRFE